MWFAIGKMPVVAMSTGIALTASSNSRRETLLAFRALCKLPIAAGAMRNHVAARLFNLIEKCQILSRLKISVEEKFEGKKLEF